MTDEKLLTVAQLAVFLQVSEESVRRYTRSGDLKCSKLGRQLRFSKAQIEDFLQRFADKELPEEPEDTTLTPKEVDTRPVYLADFIHEHEQAQKQKAETESDSAENKPTYLTEDGDYL